VTKRIRNKFHNQKETFEYFFPIVQLLKFDLTMQNFIFKFKPFFKEKKLQKLNIIMKVYEMKNKK